MLYFDPLKVMLLGHKSSCQITFFRSIVVKVLIYV